MNRVIIAVVVCLIISDSTSATDQHLICKSVDDVFTSDEQIHSTRRLRGPINQGRPGKVGPPGTKGETGEKGQRGSEGIVDYTLINETLNEMVTSATAELQAKDDKLENKILNMTELHRLATAELQAKVEKLEKKILNITRELYRLVLDDCRDYDGLIYGQKCYFVKVQSNINRAQGEQICNENNARLADIQSMAHQSVLMNYMRGKIPYGQTYLDLWLGPKYEATTRAVRLFDGRSLSASTLRWHTGYPSGSSTEIRLQATSDESSSYQGIYNYDEGRRIRAVLCEK